MSLKSFATHPVWGKLIPPELLADDRRTDAAFAATITPAMALFLSTEGRFPGQRNPVPSRMLKYTRDMKRGQWVARTHVTVCYCAEDDCVYILDAQHRILAVYGSDTVQTFHVGFMRFKTINERQDYFSRIDGGQPRTVKDHLEAQIANRTAVQQGEVALEDLKSSDHKMGLGASRILISGFKRDDATGRDVVDQPRLIATYLDTVDSERRIVGYMAKGSPETVGPLKGSALLAVLLMVDMYDRDACYEIIRLLCHDAVEGEDRSPLQAGRPLLAAQKYLKENRTAHAEKSDTARALRFGYCIDMHLENRFLASQGLPLGYTNVHFIPTLVKIKEMSPEFKLFGTPYNGKIPVFYIKEEILEDGTEAPYVLDENLKSQLVISSSYPLGRVFTETGIIDDKDTVDLIVQTRIRLREQGTKGTTMDMIERPENEWLRRIVMADPYRVPARNRAKKKFVMPTVQAAEPQAAEPQAATSAAAPPLIAGKASTDVDILAAVQADMIEYEPSAPRDLIDTSADGQAA